jgi:hypothetical protein
LILAFQIAVGKNLRDIMNNLFGRRPGTSLFALLTAACLLFAPYARAVALSHPAAAGAVPALPAGSADIGPVPSSQSITLTLHFAPGAQQAAALMQFLHDVQTPGTAAYHQWLTPQSFGAQFGLSAAQLAQVQSFAAANGLAVTSVAASGLRVGLSGTVAQVEAALAPALHQVQVAGSIYFANTNVPALPTSLGLSLASVDGLSTLPVAHPLTIIAGATVAADDALADMASAVESNTERVIAVSGDACVEDFSSGDQAAFQTELRQATAQGMTVLASSGCGTRGAAGFPSALSEVTSVAVAQGLTPAVNPSLTELRPAWQAAPGLPSDLFRHEPDFTVSSLAGLVQTVNTILTAQPANADGSAARLGNIDATIYLMAPMQGLFTQADGSASPMWEAATGLGVVNLKNLADWFPRAGSIATRTTVQGLPTSPVQFGQSISVYATVTDQNSVPIPTSNPVTYVTFSSTPSGLSASEPLQNGTTATYTTNTLPAGSYNIIASYPGDATYAASTSSNGNLTIQTVPLTIGFSLPGNAQFGNTFNVPITVQGVSSDTPTGTVTLTEYGTQTYTYMQTLTASGTPGTATANFTIPALQAGALTVQITCTTPDASYTCGSSGQYGKQLTVAKAAAPAGTLTVQPTPPVYGTNTTLTAMFAGVSMAQYPYPGPTGYTNIQVNGQTVTGGNLDNTGTFTGSSSTISGTVNDTYTALYNGDTNYAASTATASSTGTKIVTSIMVNAPSKTAVVTGGQVNFSATLTLASAPNGLTPTGTVQFYSNGAQLGQAVQVSSGTGGGSTTITVPLSYQTLQTIGTDTITATYSGDTNYQTSTSTNSVMVLVGPATVITLASNSGTTLTYGSSLTITANVTATPTSGANYPAGTLTLTLSGGTTPQTQTVTLSYPSPPSTTSSGQAVFTGLTAGTYTVTATCATVNFDCTNVYPNTIMVTVGKAATATKVTSSPAAPTAGQTVTLTATVSVTTPIAGVTPSFTGNVTFYDNGNNIGSPGVSTTGVATLTTMLAGANDTVTAVYSGDTNFLTSTGTLSVTSAPVTTTSVLTVNPMGGLAGSNFILTASVSASTALNVSPGTPAGQVSFYDTYNGQQVPLGTAPLVASGAYLAIGQIQTTGLKAGTHSIYAVYSTNSSFTGSTSNVVTVNVTDYSVTFSPSVLTLSAGSSGTVVATISAVNGFAGQVVLGCTPPAGAAATCVFNPSVINVSGTSQLLIRTTAPQARRTVQHAGLGRDLVGAAMAALLMGFLLPGLRRRRPLLLMLMASCVLLGGLGCTNLNNVAGTTSGSGGGTPQGTQIFSITTSGTDGVTTNRHDFAYQVVIQ